MATKRRGYAACERMVGIRPFRSRKRTSPQGAAQKAGGPVLSHQGHPGKKPSGQQPATSVKVKNVTVSNYHLTAR